MFRCGVVVALGMSLGACTLLFAPTDNASVDASTNDCLADPVGICRQCLTGSDCESSICDPISLVCISAVEAIYLHPDGVDPSVAAGDACTLVAPCQTMTTALATHREASSRTWIAFLNTSQDPGGETVYAIDPLDISTASVVDEVSLYGDKVVLTTNDDTKALARITGGARVRMLGLELRGPASGTNVDAHGIFCGNGASVFLYDAKISRAQRRGIQSNGCRLTVIRSQITDSGLAGLFSEDTDLLVVSSLIARNGASHINAGGVGIRTSTSPVATGATGLYFNTIVFNESAPDLDAAGGVRCFSLGPQNSITAVGNIVQNNTGHRNVFDATGACVFEHSIVALALDGDTGGGQGTLDSPVGLDASYNLAPGTSPAVDVEALVDTLGSLPLTSPLILDVDGAARKVGDFPDMGAKERQP